MSHPRKYAIALLAADSSLIHLYAARLSLAEASAWLDAHQRAPSPDGQPCILLQPILDRFAQGTTEIECSTHPGTNNPG